MQWDAWRRSLGLLAPLMLIGAVIMTPLYASASRVPTTTGMAASVHVYLVVIGDNGKSGPKVGCGDSLVAVKKMIVPTRAPLTAAVRTVIWDHRQFHGESGLYNALYQYRLELKRATVANGTATVYLTGKLRLAGVCDAPRVRAQLRQSALQFPTVQRVFVYVNGVLLSMALSSK